MNTLKPEMNLSASIGETEGSFLTLTIKLDIDAPIESVFSLISQPEEHKKWLDNLEEVLWKMPLSPEHPLGSKWMYIQERGEKKAAIECEIMEYYEPYVFSFLISSHSFPLEITYRLESLVGNKCRLHFRAMIAPTTSFNKMLGTMYLLWKKFSIKMKLKKLKQILETQTTSKIARTDQEKEG